MQLEVNEQITGRDLVEMLDGDTGTFYAQLDSQAYLATISSDPQQQSSQSGQPGQYRQTPVATTLTSLRPIGRRVENAHPSSTSSNNTWFVEKLTSIDISRINSLDLSRQEVQNLFQNLLQQAQQSQQSQQQRFRTGGSQS